MKKRHTTAEWEAVKPLNVIYDHFYYNARRKVLGVHGFIKVVKRVILSDGTTTKKNCVRKVYWNERGHCFILPSYTRSIHYDIPFSDSGSHQQDIS